MTWEETSGIILIDLIMYLSHTEYGRYMSYYSLHGDMITWNWFSYGDFPK